MALRKCPTGACLEVLLEPDRADVRCEFQWHDQELLSCVAQRSELAVVPRGRHAWHADNLEDSGKVILAFIGRD